MLQNHVGVAHVSESMFAAEEQTPGLDECQDFVLDLKVASSLPCDKDCNRQCQKTQSY